LIKLNKLWGVYKIKDYICGGVDESKWIRKHSFNQEKKTSQKIMDRHNFLEKLRKKEKYGVASNSYDHERSDELERCRNHF
jgi:hypothetical protein